MLKKICLPLLILVLCFYSNLSIVSTDQSSKESETILMLAKLFPDKQFRQAGSVFKDQENQTYLIVQEMSGIFVKPGSQERLLIIQRPKEELHHVDGFYQAYVGVFDQTGTQLLSSVHPFAADFGEFHFYRGKDHVDILFFGSVVYQGIPSYQIGLWQADKTWRMIWPTEPGFEDKYIKIDVKNEKILLEYEKVIAETPKQTVEKCVDVLQWDAKREIFIK